MGVLQHMLSQVIGMQLVFQTERLQIATKSRWGGPFRFDTIIKNMPDGPSQGGLGRLKGWYVSSEQSLKMGYSPKCVMMQPRPF